MNKSLYLGLFFLLTITSLTSCGPSVPPEFLGAEHFEITAANPQALNMRTRLIFESRDGGKAMVNKLEMTPYVNGIRLGKYSLISPMEFSRAPLRHRQFIFLRYPNTPCFCPSDSLTNELFDGGPIGKTVDVKIVGHADLTIAGKDFNIPFKVKRKVRVTRPRSRLKPDDDYANEDNEHYWKRQL